ncbi:hypothetical protein K5549_015764, partial [Capra hircus]
MLDDSRDPTPLLKEIRDDKVSTIIIDANASISHLILRKASELGMTSAFYKYILTTMDFPILHLDGVVEDSSNILGFSMFNTSHPFYPEFVRSLNMSWRENCEASTYPGPALSAALMFDAVHPAPCASNPLPRLLAPSGPAFLRLCCSPSRSRPVSLSHLLSVHLWSFLVPLPLSVCRLLPLGPCHPSLCPPPALLG